LEIWLGILFLCFGIGWSLCWRIRRLRANEGSEKPGPMETKSSPFSIAVQELVATAGGVYLSLVMLVSFLKLDLPGKINLFQISMDPLALTAIMLAIFQPLFFRLFKKT